MDANEVLRVQDAVLILVEQAVSGILHFDRVCPVSIELSVTRGVCWPATYLASSVNYLCSKLLPLITYGFAEGILDGRIVAVNKMPVDKLNGKRRFAYASGYPSSAKRTS